MHIAPLSFGMSAKTFAICTMFATTERELFEPYLHYTRAERADIRLTAFYRPTARGGFLVRARRGFEYGEPYLHLMTTEHGSTGEPFVFEWVAPWDEVPPTTVVPPDTKEYDFSCSNVRSVDRIVDLLVRRVGKHLRKQVRAAGFDPDAPWDEHE